MADFPIKSRKQKLVGSVYDCKSLLFRARNKMLHNFDDGGLLSRSYVRWSIVRTPKNTAFDFSESEPKLNNNIDLTMASAENRHNMGTIIHVYILLLAMLC